jgi:hypothetical protein
VLNNIMNVIVVGNTDVRSEVYGELWTCSFSSLEMPSRSDVRNQRTHIEDLI